MVKKRIRRKTEASIQTEFIDWCRLNDIFIYSIPNEGCTSVVFGKKLNEMGREKGMPDTCLPYPRGGFGALYIEFKRPGQKLRKSQKEMQAVLEYCGSKVVVCDNLQDAIKITIDYLKNKHERKVIIPDTIS